jgi:polyhydroxybutyrate depolymerase
MAGGCSSQDKAEGAATSSSSAASLGAGAGPTSGAGGGAGAGGAGGAKPIGGDRPVTVHVPPGYDGSKAVPLVVLLHGYGASGALQEAYFQLKKLADANGFLYVHPDGTQDAGGKRFWAASDACCDFGKKGVDDSAYLKGVVDDIKAAYKVDPKRVFFIGHSNGGFMSYRMACDHAPMVAAMVSLAGAMPKDPTMCKASEPVSVLQIHGDKDETVLYQGGTFAASAAYPGAPASIDQWLTIDGCASTADTSPAPLDLEGSLTGDETTIARYASGCKPGGHAELWTIKNGGHIPALSPSFAPKVIEFLLAHPKP